MTDIFHIMFRWALGVIIFALLSSQGFAEVRVQMTAIPSQVDIAEQLQLDVIAFISGDSRPTGELLMEDLPGIQAFDIVGSSQSIRSISTLVDGVTHIEQGTIFSFALVARESGDHVLGPITVDTTDGVVTSNTVTVVVDDPNRADAPASGFWIGIVVIIAAVLSIIGALVRTLSSKKIPPLMRYSDEEIKDRILQCDNGDALFFLLQDILAHDHGDRVRTYPHEQIEALSDDPKLHHLLRLLRDSRYTPSRDDGLAEVKRAFISYIDTYDAKTGS